MKIDVLDAIKQMVRCYNVKLMIIKDNDVESDFDIGFHKGIISEEENRKILEWARGNIKEGTIYYGTDFFAVEHCVARIPKSMQEDGGIIWIGPYFNEMIDDGKIQELMSNESIPMEYRTNMAEYFRAIPIIKNCEQWREMCKGFVEMMYDNELLHVEYIEQHSLRIEAYENMQEDIVSQKIVESRYEYENEFMRAVSEGNLEEAIHLHMQLGKFRIAKRHESQIRELRNGAIIINTLLRKAVEMGDVHPVHIDRLSTKFSIKIEAISSTRQYEKLINEMIRKYCHLVQDNSISSNSPVIQKIANYININLTEDLSLNTLAEKYAMSASYLSTLFKKEMGFTITDYANRQRIRKATKLLNTTDLQIHDIASKCGIYDSSYFRKLFKRYIGLTPSEYMKIVRNE